MPIKGREDLYNYTYLSANKYLDKFRNALGMPNLTLSYLVALLKTFNNRLGLKGFIVPNRDGKLCLYYKQTLNKILGMSDDGHFYTKPEQNPNLQVLNDIIEYWERKNEPSVEKPNNSNLYDNDEEDMQKMSDRLSNLEESKKKIVKNDEGETVPETCPDCGGKIGVYIQGEPVYLCSKCKKYFGTMPFNLKESKKGKKIYVSESQLKKIKQYISESYFVEPKKVKIVEDFLDKTFVRGAIPTIGEDGYAKQVPIVAMNIPGSEEKKNMTATQAFYLLQDKFNKIYSEPKQRDNFLKKVLIDWYYKRISKDGLLSKNNY